jgi:hypothetical protein
MASKPLDLGTKIKAVGQPYAMSTAPAPAPELPERASVLPERLQEIARQYIAARQKAGESLLEMGQWLSEARQEAVHGQWKLFLEATGTSEDQAESFIGVHKQAMRDPRFAAAVRENFLSLSAAYELISAPADVQEKVLRSEQPTTRKQIREEKRAANSAPARSFEQATLPAMPAPSTSDIPPEYDIIKRRLQAHGITLLSSMQGQHRAFVTRKEGMTGVVTFDWADVLSKLERLEAHPDPDPSAPAFRMTCPTCGETIVNGIWGDQQECGSCYHARQQQASAPAPALSPAAITPAAPMLDSPSLIDLDTTRMPSDLHRAGYYWDGVDPFTIASNDGWKGDGQTVEQALSLAHDREAAKGEPRMIALPPFPTSDLPALMDAIRRIVQLFANKTGPTYESVAPALKLLRAIGRMALEASEEHEA